jgi:hypothetical protein
MTAASSHVNHRRPQAGRSQRPFRAAALVALAGALAFAAQVRRDGRFEEQGIVTENAILQVVTFCLRERTRGA